MILSFDALMRWTYIISRCYHISKDVSLSSAFSLCYWLLLVSTLATSSRVSYLVVPWLSILLMHSETEPESDVDSVNDDVNKDTDEWIAMEPSGSKTLDSFEILVRLFMSTYAASNIHVVIA